MFFSRVAERILSIYYVATVRVVHHQKNKGNISSRYCQVPEYNNLQCEIAYINIHWVIRYLILQVSVLCTSKTNSNLPLYLLTPKS